MKIRQLILCHKSCSLEKKMCCEFGSVIGSCMLGTLTAWKEKQQTELTTSTCILNVFRNSLGGIPHAGFLEKMKSCFDGSFIF